LATGVRLKRSSDFRRAVHSTGARPPRPAAHRRSGRSAKTIARPCHGRRRQRKRWASACFYNAIGGRSAKDDGFASDTQRQNNPTTFARQVTCCGLAVSLSRTETSGLSAPSPGGVKVELGLQERSGLSLRDYTWFRNGTIQVQNSTIRQSSSRRIKQSPMVNRFKTQHRPGAKTTSSCKGPRTALESLWGRKKVFRFG
jgi:hypothetical protein